MEELQSKLERPRLFALGALSVLLVGLSMARPLVIPVLSPLSMVCCWSYCRPSVCCWGGLLRRGVLGFWYRVPTMESLVTMGCAAPFCSVCQPISDFCVLPFHCPTFYFDSTSVVLFWCSWVIILRIAIRTGNQGRYQRFYAVDSSHGHGMAGE